MTIREAVQENLDTMRAAGLDEGYVAASEMKEFGDMEIISRRSLKGRKGKIHTVFTVANGEVGFWPLANRGPRIGWYRKVTHK